MTRFWLIQVQSLIAVLCIPDASCRRTVLTEAAQDLKLSLWHRISDTGRI